MSAPSRPTRRSAGRQPASQLLLIGEAANRLSEAFQADHDQVPWAQITAMRNRLIHEYDRINWHLVWRTATEDVPRLLAELAGLVSAYEPPAADESGDNH